MTKNAERREKFRKIGEALYGITWDGEVFAAPKTGDPGSPDYHTGKPSTFHRVNESSDEVNTIHGIGPVFKTPQWIRTVKTLKTRSK